MLESLLGSKWRISFGEGVHEERMVINLGEKRVLESLLGSGWRVSIEFARDFAREE